MKSETAFLSRIRNLKNRYAILWKTYWLLVTLPVIIRAGRIFSKIKYAQQTRGCKVIVFSVRTIPGANLTYFDSIFAHGFRKLGCDVKMLICDGLLDSCDVDTVYQDQKKECYYCNRLRPLVKNATRLDYISFGQYISQSDIEEIEQTVARLDFDTCSNYQYLGVDVGKYARSAAIKFFLTGWLDMDEPQHLATLRKKLVYSMIMTRIASNLYAEEKPDRILMLHGIYATWGPFADFFINKGVDVVVYAKMVARFGNYLFTRNTREFELMAEGTWAEFKKTPLTDEEEAEIDAYLSARFKGALGERLIYEKNIDPASDRQARLAALSDDGYSRRYALYPNLAWDACVEGRGSTAFNDLFTWLKTTIDYFREHTDYQLIIKLHPAELVWEKGTRSVAEYIADRYPDLPDNITMLMPDTPLTAYDLIAPSTICLTYGGTIGLELATQGVPVLAGGNAHYIDAGVIRKIENVEEYMRLLDNPAELSEFARKNQGLAKKYAYFYYLRLMINIPFYREDGFGKIDWEAMKHINELLDDNGTVMQICKRIIGKEDIVLPFE